MTPPDMTSTIEPQAEPIVIHVPPYDEPVAPTAPTIPSPGTTTTTTMTITSLPLAEPLPAPVKTPQPALATEPKRASALDALRGLFLVSMTLGFTISNDHLPIWMYHRQFPPPGDTAVDVAGISWRDLTYVSFLFTMASALPLTLSRRIDKGEPELAIVFATIRRYGLLLLFGLLMAHANTFFIGYTQPARLVSILGFCIMGALFTRRRSDWDEVKFSWVRRAGWVAAIAFFALTPLMYGKTFSFSRIDDVIADLAFASLVGSLLWYFTRDRLNLRLAALAVVVALYFGAKSDGWIQDWWYASPAPWAFTPSQLALLCIVIPGTIAGDIVRRWMKSPDDVAVTTSDAAPWTNRHLGVLAALCAIITPIFVVGMYTRAVESTTEIVLALLAVGFALTWKASTPRDRMLRTLFMWGALWLTVGLFLEPAEGGIKKVPVTLSYFFGVTGTTSLLLVAFTALIDGMKRRKWVHALIDVGQNPLLGYVVFTVLLNPLLEMIPPLRPVLMATPGESIVRSLIEVTAVVLALRYVTHRRIYWRT